MVLILFLLLLLFLLYPLYLVNNQRVKLLQSIGKLKARLEGPGFFPPQKDSGLLPPTHTTTLHNTAQLPLPSVCLALELSSHATYTKTKLTAKPWDQEILVSINLIQTLPSSLGLQLATWALSSLQMYNSCFEKMWGVFCLVGFLFFSPQPVF